MKYVIGIIAVYLLTILLCCISFNVNKADYLILLGAGLRNNKESLTMITRVNRAVLYLNQNQDCKVVVSGGVIPDNTISEAEVMKRLLIERHISEDRILVEDKAVNTRENMLFSKEFIDLNSKIVVCSSDYHVFRAKLLAQKYGYKCKSIFSQSNIFELLIHLPIEGVVIIRDLLFY